nr:MAG TPA: hypothetical protein [Caudoviricetes sp.]
MTFRRLQGRLFPTTTYYCAFCVSYSMKTDRYT